MILESKQLTQIYEALIKPFGHPDPLGFMTRVLLKSEGDPDYIGVDGRRGFMPVQPEVALEMTGATEVQSLEGNIIATLTMDRMFFDEFRNIDNMIVAFHYGADRVDLSRDIEGKPKLFIEEVNDSRQDTNQLMYPPLATVANVIDVLDPRNIDRRLTGEEKDFFKFLRGQ